jgi:hypothetical protein
MEDQEVVNNPLEGYLTLIMGKIKHLLNNNRLLPYQNKITCLLPLMYLHLLKDLVNQLHKVFQ